MNEAAPGKIPFEPYTFRQMEPTNIRFIWGMIMIAFAVAVSFFAHGFYSHPGITLPFIVVVCALIFFLSGPSMVFTFITIDEEGVSRKSWFGEVRKYQWNEIYEAGLYSTSRYGGRFISENELDGFALSKNVYVSKLSIQSPWSIAESGRMISFHFNEKAFELLKSRIDQANWRFGK